MNNYTMQFNYLEHKGNENSGRYRRGSGMRPYQHGGLFSRFKRGGATVKTSKKISKGSPSNKNRGPTNNPQHNHQNQNQNRLPGYDERRPGQNYKKSVKEVSKMSDRELNDHVSRLRKQKEARQISNYLLDKHAHDKPKPDSIFVKAGREVGEKALKGAGSYSLKALTQGKFDKYELGEAMFYGGPGGKKQVTQTVKKVVKHNDINSNYLIHYGVKGMKWDPSKRKYNGREKVYDRTYFRDKNGNYIDSDTGKVNNRITNDANIQKRKPDIHSEVHFRPAKGTTARAVEDGIKIIGNFFNDVVKKTSSFINSGKKFISRLFS